MPRARAAAVICAPPPCTMQTRDVARHARDRRDGIERGVAAQLDHDEAAHVKYSALNVTYSGESEEA